jgi:molybdenum cofactor cytidylyltransferase
VGVHQNDPILERWAPLAAVILAAGQSSRMGRAKQVEIVDGEAMVLRAVRTALQSAVHQVFVVTGAYAETVTATLLPVLHEAGDRLRLIHNPDWQTGQASSIRTAAQALSAQPGTVFGAALFMPTDQPFVPTALLQQLICTWRAGARIVAPLVDGQVRGAPALFDRLLWPEMLTLEGDIGARPLLQKYRPAVVTLAVSARLLRDIDTPQDLI